jgi:hypothetical protein
MKIRDISAAISFLIAIASFPVVAQEVHRTRPPERETMQLVLGRICAHEASLPGHDEGDADDDGETVEWVRRREPSRAYGVDCAAIHEVLLRGALHMEEARRERHVREGRAHRSLTPEQAYIQFAHAYSTRVFTMVETDTNRWTHDLRSDGSEPEGWRRTVTACRDGVCRIVPGPSWARAGRDAWLYVYGLAVELVTHTLADREAWSPCESEIDDWGGRMDHEHARSIGLVPVACGEPGATANTFYARPSRIALRSRIALGEAAPEVAQEE